MKKYIFLIIILSFASLIINSYDYYATHTDIKLNINLGFSYHLPITTDYNTQAASLFLDVPLCIGVDIRKSDWVSFYTGIEAIYGINYQKFLIEDEYYYFYTNSLFIRIPFMAKFYPMFKKNDAFQNFYIGIGGILHFWAINYYYVVTSENLVHTGNNYKPYHDEMPPGDIYTPVNLGLKFCIGNHFYVSNRVLLGIEFYTTYLFIPFINGYYFSRNYNRGGNVILEFDLNAGLAFSIAVELND